MRICIIGILPGISLGDQWKKKFRENKGDADILKKNVRVPFVFLELWAWHKPHQELVNRKASPWDHADRRPSHADRRNALRRICLESEFKRDPAVASFDAKTRRLWARLLSLVA